RWAMRWTITRVFPEPAPARTSSGPSVRRTASLWAGLRWERSTMGGAEDSGGRSRLSTDERGSRCTPLVLFLAFPEGDGLHMRGWRRAGTRFRAGGSTLTDGAGRPPPHLHDAPGRGDPLRRGGCLRPPRLYGAVPADEGSGRLPPSPGRPPCDGGPRVGLLSDRGGRPRMERQSPRLGRLLRGSDLLLGERGGGGGRPLVRAGALPRDPRISRAHRAPRGDDLVEELRLRARALRRSRRQPHHPRLRREDGLGASALALRRALGGALLATGPLPLP